MMGNVTDTIEFWKRRGPTAGVGSPEEVAMKKAESGPSYAEIAREDWSGQDLGWLLDYAKFRCDYIAAARRSVEDRSLSLLRAVGAATAAAWAVFAWASPRLPLSIPGQLAVITAAVLLAATAVLCALVTMPRVQTLPARERFAFVRLSKHPDVDQRANFAAALADTSDLQTRALHRKARLLHGAYWSATAAVVILLLALTASAVGGKTQYGQRNARLPHGQVRAVAALSPIARAFPARSAGYHS